MDMPAELSFFNQLSGTLEIVLDEAPVPLSPQLANVRAPATASIKSVHLRAREFLRDVSDFRDLTPEELDSVALRRPRVTLAGEAGIPVEHAAPNGKEFTVQQLLAAVERTEAETRAQSEWFEGIDVHHVFFEGLHLAQDGSFVISWGS